MTSSPVVTPTPPPSVPSQLPAKLYALIFSLLPIAALTWVWSLWSINVPKWDDHTLKALLLGMEKATSLPEAIQHIIKQHNEHRIAYDRVIAWLDYSLFGKLSYTRLMAYGDLSLLALVALFGVYLARYTQRWYLFLPPVVLFIINLANWENLFWAMSAVQNFAIVIWSMWAFYTLSHRPSPWLAIGLAAVATLISGNGILLWPVGAAMLFVQHRHKHMVIWLGAGALVLFLYFFDYVQPSVAPSKHDDWLKIGSGLLAFLGAAADALPFYNTYWLSAGLGTLLVGFWLYVFVKVLPDFRKPAGWSARDTFAAGAVAFAFGTAAVVVWNRVGWGESAIITSRYRIYSLTLLALTYCYWLSAFYKKSTWQAALGGLVVAGAFWWSAFIMNQHDAYVLRRFFVTSQFNWTYRSPGPVSNMDSVTSRLIDNAPAFYDSALSTIYGPATGPLFPIDSVFRNPDNYLIQVSAAGLESAGVPSLRHPDQGVWIQMHSPKRTYLINTMPLRRRNWRVPLGLLPIYNVREPFIVPIPLTELDADTYSINALVVAADGSTQLRPTQKTLTVLPYTLKEPVKNW
ncbi:hypothetical protein FAES_3182 [Fibrella aestuarina BUZ 2]|uniref:Transmembrane protein n=1 Tax=Fibrella aestuarina BUZ 2 TaxID=1166018 RepID=I0KAN8_9BACT|nr:hypothetical protein [Fibrella aestuarina]CCH01191.1 hypothetical protein FAES_3182 [Fibrella aestuarina BUZ 2]